MKIDDQLRHAKRVIADQAIQFAALSEALESAQEELWAAKAALSKNIGEALGQEVVVDGTVAMTREA